MKKETIIKVGAGVLVGLLSGMIAGPGAFPNTVYQEVPVNVTKFVDVPYEVVVNKTVEVPVEVEKIVEIEVIKEVDNGNIDIVCEKLMFDDVKECIEEVKAEDVALELAFEEIKKEFSDVLEDADYVDDEDDVKLVGIYKDFEDIEVLKSDFDDDEYEFKIKVKVDDDGDKEKYYFHVEVQDGEPEITFVEELD